MYDLQIQNPYVAITGHTSGIGKSLFGAFSQMNNSKVVGYSRSNGFDLEHPQTIQRIVESAANADIFVNNAYYDWAQIDLLYSLYEKWEADDRKYIVNISSNSGDTTKTFSHKYASTKTALDKACTQLNNAANRRCQIINIRPGWVSTPRTVQFSEDNAMLSTSDVVRTVIWTLSLPSSVRISSITIEPNR